MLKKSFAPVVDSDSRLLVLGSLPGDASLSRQEYYAYKHNAFWKIMGELLGFDPLMPYEDRLQKIREGGVALWDVVEKGIRPGSLDSSLSDIIPNDVPCLLTAYPGINSICCNGGTSFRLLKRYFPVLFEGELTIHQMPSTSPAAARMRYEEKLNAYRKVMQSILTQK